MKKRSKIAILVSLLLVVGLATWVTTRREWVQNKVLDAAIRKISPSLPFKIISYRLSKNRDFLEFEILWNAVAIHVAGALDMQWHGNHFGWTVHYLPEVKLGDATPLRFVFDLEAPTNFEQINKMTLVLEKTQSAFLWKKFGIDVQKPALNLSILHETGDVALGFSAASAIWSDPQNDNHAVSTQTLELTALKSATGIEATMRGRSAEVLWDKFYADLPMSELPIQIVTSDQRNFSLVIGKNAELKLRYEMGEKGPDRIHWQAGRVDHARVVQWLLKALAPIVPSLSPWTDLEMKHGRISIRGSARVEEKNGFQLEEVFIDASKVGFRSLSHLLAIKSLSFSLPYRESEAQHELSLEIKEGYFKKIPFALEKTNFVWSPSGKKGFLRSEEAIRLSAAQIPIHLGRIEGTLGPKSDDRFQFSTALKVETDQLEGLRAGLCLPEQSFPPAKLKIDFSEIDVTPGVIDPRGKAEVDLFKGKVVLNEIGMYDYQSEVPELNFDLDWVDLDLQAMGDWTRFGEIKGTLEGHAHDVVFQAFLPTQYDFLVQVRSLNRHKTKSYVEFSPDAMKNVVKIFTGEDLDEQIPGIAGWLMFGWPSRVFGGYDVQFAGISVESSNGVIVVETLDPPELVAETRKHFILYGPRFKMPIRSVQYPLVLDATAMSNFVHQMVTRFMSLKGDEDEKPTDCNPPEL